MKIPFCLLIAAGIAAAQNVTTCTCQGCAGKTTPTEVYTINRFNPQDKDIVYDFYLYMDKQQPNKAYFISGYMDISDAPPDSELSSNKGIRFISFFDKDKKYLSYVNNTNPVPIPPGAAYARLTLNKNLFADLNVKVTKPKPAPANVGFVNDICMPSTLYMLSETQNDLFIQPMIKRWRPYDDFVRFSVSNGGKFLRQLSHVASINAPVDGSTLTTQLINGDEFKVLKSISTKIKVGVKGQGDKEVVAQIIGDSYTNGLFYKEALIKSGAVPKLRLVGLRKSDNVHFDEGRGGWTLNNYFTIPTRPVSSYHGYMQPEGDFRYWGSKEFWATCWKCFRNTAGNGFEPRYSCGRFNSCLERFDEATGTLLSPKAGDIQFDNKSNSFLLFDGQAWIPKQEKDFTWSFDYSKYLAMWNIDTPQFLFVVLGLNDFCTQLDADFSTWGKQITILKNSFLKANPKGKFGLCIPCSTSGSLDNDTGTFTLRYNAAMWRFRKYLIDNFDKREKDGFYLIDTGVGIDNENGYNLMKSGPALIPYAGAQGTLKIQTGIPHPYANYPTMGIPIAAFIQAFRNE